MTESGSGDGPPETTEPTSYNPKSWIERPSAGPPESPTEASFDPKTWGPSSDLGVMPSTSPPHRWPVLVAGAIGLLLVLGLGASWWVLSRPHSEPAPPVIRASAASRGTVEVETFAAIEPALRVSGLGAAEARNAATALASATMDRSGPMRVTLTSTGSPGDAKLVTLDVRNETGAGARVIASPGGLVTTPLAADHATRVSVARGEIGIDSLYAAAVSAGVPDQLIGAFAQAFAYDFDFQREIGPGDQFEAAYEENINGPGDRVGAPRLVYAALNTASKSKAFYLFKGVGDAEAAWYDASGNSAARGLMRTPVEGARVTSAFGPRLHPVLGYTRMHKGVDFGVPIGTAVFASADGVVEFVGLHGGHGNYIAVRHSAHLATAYAHLSQFEVAVGGTVRQGQEIARSGNTGLSSGPHLHYEVIVDGAQTDPLTYAPESEGRRLTGLELARFLKFKEKIDRARAVAV